MIYFYGGNASTDRRLTLTVDSIEPLSCIAEYLPENLIPTAEGSVVQWLDSAPQLPEANGSCHRLTLRSAGMIWRQ